jgi:hypothetical protein
LRCHLELVGSYLGMLSTTIWFLLRDAASNFLDLNWVSYSEYP